MEHTKLKLSKFNYSVKDDEGNLLIYNFAKGRDSLCKVLKKDEGAYYKLINELNAELDEESACVKQLKEKGILIHNAINELMLVNSLYYESALDDKVRIIVMPTEQCNFRCKYCYESYKKGKMTSEDQLSLLKFIQRKVVSANKLQVSWFGGEPLEAVDVIENIMKNTIEMCKKRKVQFISDMTTNGYNLTPDIFDKLYSFKVYDYQITLDGTEKQHNKQRVLKNGEGTFNKIVENLLYIKNNFTKYKLASISIRVNITRDILDNFAEFIKFYKDNFANDRRFSLALTPVSDMGGSIVNEIKDKFVNIEEIYKLIKELDLFNDLSISFSNILRALSPKDVLCYASKKNTFVIGPDLSIYKCTVHFEMNENNIGKIKPNGEELINDISHRQWYANLVLREKCKNCFLLPCCYGGGCPHKRVFCEEFANKCVLKSWKSEIPNIIKYISKKIDVETIKF